MQGSLELNPLWPSDALWRRQRDMYKPYSFRYEKIPSNLRFSDILKVDIITL